MSDAIGEIYEQHGEKRIEWRVSDFMPLLRQSEMEGETKFYYSPKFFFADCCWCFEICAQGDTEKTTKLELYSSNTFGDLPKTFKFSFSIRTPDGKEQFLCNVEKTFDEWPRCDSPKLLSIFELINNEADTIPEGTLTLICTLKSQSQIPVEGSLFKRLWNLSLGLKDILSARKRTDVVLKLKEGEIPAHRMILESRSSVFKGMFNVDIPEAGTGDITIEDGDEDTFRVVLSYVYGGDPEGLCAKNACEVYEVAHKYDLKELKQLCVDCMQEYLCVDTVWNVITLAWMHEETNLKECAKNFFAKKSSELFKMEEWNDIKRKDPKLGFEVMEYALAKGCKGKSN